MKVERGLNVHIYILKLVKNGSMMEHKHHLLKHGYNWKYHNSLKVVLNSLHAPIAKTNTSFMAHTHAHYGLPGIVQLVLY
jgi:hypothetical protein